MNKEKIVSELPSDYNNFIGKRLPDDKTILMVAKHKFKKELKAIDLCAFPYDLSIYFYHPSLTGDCYIMYNINNNENYICWNKSRSSEIKKMYDIQGTNDCVCITNSTIYILSNKINTKNGTNKDLDKIDKLFKKWCKKRKREMNKEKKEERRKEKNYKKAESR